MNIQQIDLIGLPVSDQNVALEFYTKMLGFGKCQEF
jgi:catechol 2,3-dioxygenase-like lactoylglutathione lyase family enzyme